MSFFSLNEDYKLRLWVMSFFLSFKCWNSLELINNL